MQYWERLRAARKHAKLSQGALAEACHISQPTISYLEKPENNATGSEFTNRFARACNVSTAWLADEIGEMTLFALEQPEATYANPIEPGENFISITRVLFKLSAGCTGYQVEPLEGNGPPIFFRRDWIERHQYRPEKLFAVRISGASMEPGLYDGDLVVINCAEAIPLDGEVFAANYEGELVIKRLRRDCGEWWLTSDNPDKRRFGDKRCDEHASLLGRIIFKQSEKI